MSKNTLLLTDTADTVSTETSQSTSPQSTSQSASQSSSQSTLQSTLQSLSLSQRKTKIRKTNVFKSSGLYLPIIVVIYYHYNLLSFLMY